HHPAEVRATLKAARGAFHRPLVAVFQPHRFTRLRDLFDEFLAAFDDASRVYILDVYPAGEEPVADVNSRRLYEALSARGHLDVHYLGDAADAARRIASESAAGDIIVTLGAGDVYRVGEEILTALSAEAKLDEHA
ncbi:MAG: glutamate ligase domain-containing protein, partial [Candidatus Binataceae bacterium]